MILDQVRTDPGYNPRPARVPQPGCTLTEYTPGPGYALQTGYPSEPGYMSDRGSICNLGLCPDRGFNPQPFGVQNNVPTNDDTQKRCPNQISHPARAISTNSVPLFLSYFHIKIVSEPQPVWLGWLERRLVMKSLWAQFPVRAHLYLLV